MWSKSFLLFQLSEFGFQFILNCKCLDEEEDCGGDAQKRNVTFFPLIFRFNVFSNKF